MRKFIFISLLGITIIAGAQNNQELSLDSAFKLARQNYPALKQLDLVRKTAAISIENIQKGFFPQFSISGQATYQSDVTKVSIPIPGFSITPPGKDQYKVIAEATQLLYDGGLNKEQKTLQTLNSTVELQKVEVELYKVNDRISQLFLGILFLDEQLKQTELIKNDIQTGIRKMEVQVKNGIAFKSNLSMLKAELLKAGQRSIEINSTRKGLVDALSLFVGIELKENTKLAVPTPASDSIVFSISRPELKLFSEQERFISQQEKLITAKNLPKASLFVQGGYGRPGLNMLNNEFSFYSIGGVRFNWSLGGLYTKKRDKELVKVNMKMVEVQKETFLLNTNSQLRQQLAEVDKLQLLVNSDDEIIELRKSVTEAAKAQLENEVITANDFLKEVNAEDQARQSKITHKIQLLQAQIIYQILIGKF